MNTVVEIIKTKEVPIWEPPTHSPASYFNNPVYETEKIDVDLGLTSKKTYALLTMIFKFYEIIMFAWISFYK